MSGACTNEGMLQSPPQNNIGTLYGIFNVQWRGTLNPGKGELSSRSGLPQVPCNHASGPLAPNDLICVAQALKVFRTFQFRGLGFRAYKALGVKGLGWGTKTSISSVWPKLSRFSERFSLEV